jgi:hypothetical protein
VSEDLGVVKSNADNKNEVTVDLPVEQTDINEMYRAELQVLATKPPKVVHVVASDQKQEDYYKVGVAVGVRHGELLIITQNFRTNVSEQHEQEHEGMGWSGRMGEWANARIRIGGRLMLQVLLFWTMSNGLLAAVIL